MNIAIIGYGKMGHEIEKAAIANRINVTAIIDPHEKGATHKVIDQNSLKDADVCIDFTSPNSVLGNIRQIAKLKKNIVVGTTGWDSSLENVRRIVKENKIGLISSSNFSIGVNIFFRLIGDAARMFDKIEDYDVYGYEIHHKGKADSPSGTAKTIGSILIKNIKRKSKLLFDRLSRKIGSDELHFASIRAGSIPGTHVVGFDSNADTIELKHTARNREGFAQGAIMAAKWINGKKGFYTFDDMMKNVLRH